MTCQNCGAECPAETSYCRQCGAPIASEQTTALLNQTRSRRPILIGTVVIAIIGVVTAATLIGMRSHSAENDLIYPGARTVVDMKNQAGGRALHLQTSDPFNTVEAWYQKTLRPEKTMRLTSTSVVLKNGRTTATIAAEDNITNILIKVTD